MLLIIGAKLTAQPPSTYWYKDGMIDSVFYQTDVFSFKCFGGVAYTQGYDPTVVDSIVFRANRRDKSNDVYFNQNSTLVQRLQEAQNIYSTGVVQVVYLNVTKNPNQPYAMENWYTIDNLILVNFNTPYPTQTFLNSFMTQYGLSMYYEPIASLPLIDNYSYMYIFEAHIPVNELGVPDFEYFVELMRDIYTNSGGMVHNAAPNFVNHGVRNNSTSIPPPIFPPPSAPIYTMCNGGSSQPNDPYLDHQWYINNTGFNENDFPPGLSWCSPLPQSGTVGADAKICGCWDAGLSGAGVKVEIISSGEYNGGHVDLTNQSFTTKWDCTGSSCVPLVLVTNPGTGIGMSMTGIIAAKKNNGIGIAGIAENCTIIPIKIGDEFSSDANLLIAIQRALADKTDILAIDFFSTIENSTIKDELFNHHKLGRSYSAHGVAKGTILIAPAGHTNTSTTGDALPKRFPAIYDFQDNAFLQLPEVIGVINSNRFDKLETGEDIQMCGGGPVPGVENYSYPSHFGSGYDIATPSSYFFSTQGSSDIVRGWGTSVDIKQSAHAVAITAGVVALLLEDNFYQTDLELFSRIVCGADDVNQGVFTYFPGNEGGCSTGIHCQELANGRINCMNSKAFVPVGLDNRVKDLTGAILINNIDSWTVRITDLKTKILEFKVFNDFGIVVESGEAQNYELRIPTTRMSSGVYFIKLFTEKGVVNLKATR